MSRPVMDKYIRSVFSVTTNWQALNTGVAKWRPCYYDWTHLISDGNALDVILASCTIRTSLGAARRAVHEENCSKFSARSEMGQERGKAAGRAC